MPKAESEEVRRDAALASLSTYSELSRLQGSSEYETDSEEEAPKPIYKPVFVSK